MSLNYSRPTLNLQRYARNSAIGVCENKGADQLAHPRSLISAFAIHLLERIILKLVSVAEKAGFDIILSETLKTGFVASVLNYIHVNADPIHKPGSCDMHIENV